MNRDEEVKGKLQKIADTIKKELPEGYGFVVLASQFGDEPGNELMYVSNIQRKDVVWMMTEFIIKTQKNYGNDTGKY